MLLPVSGETAVPLVMAAVIMLFLYALYALYAPPSKKAIETASAKSELFENLFGENNIFKDIGFPPFWCLGPCSLFLPRCAGIMASEVAMPTDRLVACGLRLKRFFRSLAGHCPKGEEFSENRAVVVLILSQLLLFPMMMMRCNWLYVAGVCVGQLLVTRNCKATLMFLVKMCLIDAPAFVAAAIVERALAGIPGIHWVQYAAQLEFQYLGAFMALLSLVWLTSRLLAELPNAARYGGRQLCLFCTGAFINYYFWGWTCYALLLIWRRQLPIKLGDIVVSAFAERTLDVLFALVHQLAHYDPNLFNLHKAHHSGMSYNGFESETESSLERAFLYCISTHSGADVFFRFHALIFDSASHSYGLAYDCYHLHHHVNMLTNFMLTPWMYESRETFDVLNRLFKQDKFVDPKESADVLRQLANVGEVYARFGQPSLDPPSRLERCILWMSLGESVS